MMSGWAMYWIGVASVSVGIGKPPLEPERTIPSPVSSVIRTGTG